MTRRLYLWLTLCAVGCACESSPAETHQSPVETKGLQEAADGHLRRRVLKILETHSRVLPQIAQCANTMECVAPILRSSTCVFEAKLAQFFDACAERDIRVYADLAGLPPGSGQVWFSCYDSHAPEDRRRSPRRWCRDEVELTLDGSRQTCRVECRSEVHSADELDGL